MKLSPNDPCPCGRPLKFKKCCQRWHLGPAAPDAESLMRSRYSAYAAADTRYLRATTHPDGPHWRDNVAAWDQEIRDFCRQTAFKRLEVRGHVSTGAEAYVSFVATLSRKDAAGREVDASFGERSRFLCVDGRWLYHSGESFKP